MYCSRDVKLQVQSCSHSVSSVNHVPCEVMGVSPLNQCWETIMWVSPITCVSCSDSDLSHTFKSLKQLWREPVVWQKQGLRVTRLSYHTNSWHNPKHWLHKHSILCNTAVRSNSNGQEFGNKNGFCVLERPFCSGLTLMIIMRGWMHLLSLSDFGKSELTLKSTKVKEIEETSRLSQW